MEKQMDEQTDETTKRQKTEKRLSKHVRRLLKSAKNLAVAKNCRETYLLHKRNGRTDRRTAPLIEMSS